MRRNHSLMTRLGDAVETTGRLPVTPSLPRAFRSSESAILAAVAEMLELAVVLVDLTPDGPVLVLDTGLALEDFATPADGLAAVAVALGLGVAK